MTTTPLSPRIDRAEARTLAEEEFRRFAELAATLSDDDWGRPTDCTQWDVRAVALHVLGSAEAQASVPEFAHQLVHGLRLLRHMDHSHWVDGLNAVQIRERAHLSTGELVTALEAIGPRAVAGRWGTPPPMRLLPLPFGAPIGWAPLKYLLDVGFTRDVWAHRIDICTALGTKMHLTVEHDGRLLGDIVAEWAGLHGEPFDLVLTGPAGGAFHQGSGGEHVEIDALDFVRVLSGRLPGSGVLRHPLPL